MMQTVHNFLILILSTSFLFFNVQFVNGQISNDKDCPCSEIAITDQSVLLLIGEYDYPNFLNISSLNNYSNINLDYTNIRSPKTKTYTLTGSSKNATLLATYNKKDGNLINGHYVEKNTRLPRAILVTLVEENKGWTMTKNKTIVHDFDPQRTEYQVKMKNGKNKQTLYFNHAGKPIKKRSRI